MRYLQKVFFNLFVMACKPGQKKSCNFPAKSKINKTTIILAMFCFLWINTVAQAPQKMSSQAVIRDAGGNLVTSKSVGIRITVLKSVLPGTVVYQETQTPATNANGLVTFEIGGGAGFDAINWGGNVHYIKVETDPSGGTN
jgi:hypothetical protein